MIRILKRNASLLFLAFLLSACGAPEPVPVEPDYDVVDVTTYKLKPDQWVRQVRTFGLIRPAEEFEISSSLSATVIEVLFDEGQRVTAGDVLVRLDDRQLRLEKEQAEARRAEASAKYDEARSTHERNELIFEKRLISDQAFRQSEAALKSAAAVLASTSSALDIAIERLTDATLVSPVSGMVSERNIDPGKTANPMASFGTIQLENRLRVETYVSQKDINFLRTGMLARVVSPAVPGLKFEGAIESLASSAEPTTGNFKVRVSVLSANGLLMDGMSAEVIFDGLTQNNVISLPRAALVDRNRKLLVFRIVDDEAEAVAPVIGVGNGTSVPLLGGLEPGDEIVVSNLRLVSDGQKIRRTGGG
ncbi:MAG: RND family efflux transporter MFP subunit [Halieaceae bacterium]|jgi:RND family efflux transporter MFP subunit